MYVLPAVDLMDGRAVRLKQGRKNDSTEYYDDPVEPALKFAEAGASWLHVVDLDGAFEGRGRNTNVVHRIVDAVSPLGMKVELGGGIRDLDRIGQILDLGVSRVILGTAIYKDPHLLPNAINIFGPEKIVAGLDASGGMVAICGWAEVTERAALDVATEVKNKGCQRIIYTDIATDGMLEGPNLKALKVMSRVGIAVIASGGVATSEHISKVTELESLGVEGVIVGRALYEGTVTIEQALEAAGDKGRTEKD